MNSFRRGSYPDNKFEDQVEAETGLNRSILELSEPLILAG
jgi:hypothetical protein